MSDQLVPSIKSDALMCRCTHLTVDALLTHDKATELRRSGVRTVTQALLAGPNASFWSQRSFTVRPARDMHMQAVVQRHPSAGGPRIAVIGGCKLVVDPHQNVCLSLRHVCTIIFVVQLLTLLASHVVQLQLFDEVALVRDGRLLHVLSISGSEGVYPSVLALAPRFTAGEKNGDGPLLALTGAHLAGADDATVLARCQGADAGRTVRPVNSKEDLLAHQIFAELKGQESMTACWRPFADGHDDMLCVWSWHVVQL